MNSKIKLLVLLVFFAVFKTHAEVNIKGTIYNKSGEELPLVSIWIEELQMGAVASIEGHYEIAVPSCRQLNLSFYSIGMNSEKRSIQVQDRKEIVLDVVMTKSVIYLQPALVITEASEPIVWESDIVVTDCFRSKMDPISLSTEHAASAEEEQNEVYSDETSMHQSFVMKLYPNPINKSQPLTLEIDNYSEHSKQVQVSVRDMSGKEILNFLSLLKGSMFKETIELPNEISTGTYIVMVNDGTRNSYERVIVKE